MKLTPKQEAFVQAFVETNNASEAYRRAYAAARMKTTTVHQRAHDVMAKPAVVARIEALRAAHRQRHEVTVDILTEMLKADRELARLEKRPDAAINAVLALAKLHGLIVDKKKVDVDANHQHHHTVEPVSDSARWIEGLLGTGADRATPQSLPH